VTKVMIVSKVRVLIITLFLLFCVLAPLAGASNKRSDFFVKAYVYPWSFQGTIEMTESMWIAHGTQWGWVADEFGDQYGNHRIGAINVTVMLIAKLGENGLYDAEGIGTMHFTIRFDNGLTVEGTLIGRFVHPTIDGNQIVDGVFSGHGGMHVKGIVENIEVGSGFALNGYSW